MDAGILTVSERLQPTLPGVEEAATVNEPIRHALFSEVELRDGHTPSKSTTSAPTAPAQPKAKSGAPSGGAGVKRPKATTSDAPYCYQCGVQMQRAGTCFACPSCGTTSGCS
jgi:ribonucleoside-diphosphate reductase alpha chain